MKKTLWNWQQQDWPNFHYNHDLIKNIEDDFFRRSHIALGSAKALSKEQYDVLTVELATNETYKTSEIEGEILDRESLQSSLKREFGLAANPKKRNHPSEDGIAKVFHNNFTSFQKEISHTQLHEWHTMLIGDHTNIEIVGGYRTHKEDMQIVSGYIHKPKIHYVAPPSQQINKEMERFIEWFNASQNDEYYRYKPILRAAISHLWFVMIHPYEDGNGRISRELVKKSLWQSLQQPFLMALSDTIFRSRKEYYEILEKQNKTNQIDMWITYFAKIIIQSMEYTEKKINHILIKDNFFRQHADEINNRQEKVILKLFDSGIDGFKGGLSAHKYAAMTGATSSTVTRDLQNLVNLNILRKEGKLKGTRYYLKVLD